MYVHVCFFDNQHVFLDNNSTALLNTIETSMELYICLSFLPK